jgi:BirA family biotin operon repressor/biotin-[acetyl-CoA-carboxylase] ligase
VLPDDLTSLEGAIRARGGAARILPVTRSTNDDARAWAAVGAPHGALVIADMQTGGRGRAGRAWSSPSGAGLWISIVARPEVAPIALPTLSLAAGLAARRAIERRVPAARVKWPNDVVVPAGPVRATSSLPLLQGSSLRKIAGVLVEAAIVGMRVEHVVVGIGINVAATSFPSELSGIATSFAREGAHDLDRGRLALDLIEAFETELAIWARDPRETVARLVPWDALRGRRVLLDPSAFDSVGLDPSGIADGIEPDGRLRVLVGRDLVLASAGEIRLAEDLDRSSAATGEG